MDRPKPIKVKNIWSKSIFYAGRRIGPGEVFHINGPEHFSKSGYMVQLDDEGKEIRHLGGFRKVGGNYISLKGEPVYPGEEISQATEQELREQEAEDKFQSELKRLKAERIAAKMAVPTETRTAEDIERETDAIVGEETPEVSVSNQNVI